MDCPQYSGASAVRSTTLTSSTQASAQARTTSTPMKPGTRCAGALPLGTSPEHARALLGPGLSRIPTT
eukprot:1908307-Alexandrium_andersonii.AAC.1